MPPTPVFRKIQATSTDDIVELDFFVYVYDLHIWIGIYTIQMWRFAHLHIWIVQMPTPQLAPYTRGGVCVYGYVLY